MPLLGRIAAALIAAALFAQVYGLTPLWPLAWLAPIPLLIAVIGASRFGALCYGALAGLGSGALMASYLLDLAGPTVVGIILATQALTFAVIALAVRAGARYLPPAAAVFIFPALMAGVETLIAATSPHGSAGALAYSQMDFPTVLQVASLGGAPAITFIVTLFASAAAFAIAHRHWRPVVAPALIVALALGFGQWRMSAPSTTTAPVAIVINDAHEGVPEDWRAVWADYARALDDEDTFPRQQHVVPVVLPEKIALIREADVPEALAAISDTARTRNLAIVVGFTVVEGGHNYNRAYVVRPEGAPLAYDKRHVIPGLESDLTPGARDLIFTIDGVRYGVAICKDMDFPALGRSYGRAGIDVMLTPAWDFGVDGWLHGRMSVLRGVEGGYSVMRAPRAGQYTTSNAYGRVLAQPSGATQTATVTSVVPLSPGRTLYTLIGDAFGWATLALAMLLLGWTIVRSRAG